MERTCAQSPHWSPRSRSKPPGHNKCLLFIPVVLAAHIIAALEPMPVFRAFRLFVYLRRCLCYSRPHGRSIVASVGESWCRPLAAESLFALRLGLLPAIKPLTLAGCYLVSAAGFEPTRLRTSNLYFIRSGFPFSFQLRRMHSPNLIFIQTIGVYHFRHASLCYFTSINLPSLYRYQISAFTFSPSTKYDLTSTICPLSSISERTIQLFFEALAFTPRPNAAAMDSLPFTSALLELP